MWLSLFLESNNISPGLGSGSRHFYNEESIFFGSGSTFSIDINDYGVIWPVTDEIKTRLGILYFNFSFHTNKVYLLINNNNNTSFNDSLSKKYSACGCAVETICGKSIITGLPSSSALVVNSWSQWSLATLSGPRYPATTTLKFDIRKK